MNQLERYQTLDAILCCNLALDAKDQSLLLWIARSEHSESGYASGYFKDIAKASGQGSTKTLQRRIRKLESLGLVYVIRRLNPARKRHLPTLFRLVNPCVQPLAALPDAFLSTSKFYKFESARVDDVVEAGRKHSLARKFLLYHAPKVREPRLRATLEHIVGLINHRRAA
jgi:hypothetical protein